MHYMLFAAAMILILTRRWRLSQRCWSMEQICLLWTRYKLLSYFHATSVIIKHVGWIVGWRNCTSNTCQAVHWRERSSADGSNSRGSVHCRCEEWRYCWCTIPGWDSVARSECQCERSCKLGFIPSPTIPFIIIVTDLRTEWACWYTLQEEAISPCLNTW